MADLLNIKLMNNPLVYRKLLTIPRKENFGLELELDIVNYDEVSRLVKNQFGTSWKVKTDQSLTLGTNAEIVSPKLQNNRDTWVMLKKMGDLLKYLNPSYTQCSFQVNFDGRLLPDIKDRVRFLKLYAMYEDIIYRFSKGEDSKYRETLDTYAAPIILTLKGVSQLGDDGIVDMFSNNKRYGVVFKTEGKDLIEFRTPNMTSNPILWQNYVTTFYYLLTAATSNRYPKNEVDEYIDKFYRIYILEDYEKEKKEKAVEFTKRIFPRSVDQISFMHQYLGTTRK